MKRTNLTRILSQDKTMQYGIRAVWNNRRTGGARLLDQGRAYLVNWF